MSWSGYFVSLFVSILSPPAFPDLRLRDFFFMLRAENLRKCGIFDKKLTIFERKSLKKLAVYSICEVFGEVTQVSCFLDSTVDNR